MQIGKRWVFACALDWPGWCRRAKSEDLALRELAAYAPRYAVVARRAAVVFPGDALEGFAVTERLPSTSWADYGAPYQDPQCDHAPLDALAASRMGALVRASWEVFNAVASEAPAGLRKSPRGVGRDRDEIIVHVLATDARVGRKLGIRVPAAGTTDLAAWEAMHIGIVDLLSRPSDGACLGPKGLTARCAARRIAWHALDHAWEIEDRSEPVGT
jgi:hypothetical protein